MLKSRNYGLLWWSGFLSNVGTWMQTVALGALVTELTDSAAWGSATAAVLFLLNGLVTPFAGVFADRYRKRSVLTVVVLLEAALASVLALAYVTDHASPAFIVVNVALEGALLAFVLPAQGALIPLLVKRDDITQAMALGTASWNLGRAIGPALAGVIIASSSYTWIFVVNAVTFVLIAVAIAAMNVREPTIHPAIEGPIQRLKDGFRVVRAEPGCRLALLIVSAVALTISPFIALIPAMSQLVFKGTAVDTAHFVTAQGIGAVIASFSIGATVKRFGHRAVLQVTLVVLPLAELLFAISPTKNFAIATLFGVGFFYAWFLVGLNTLIQLRVDPAYRGRAIAMFWTSISLFYPAGAAVQGWLGDLVGVREVIATASGFMLIAMVLAMVFVRRRFSVLTGLSEIDQLAGAGRAVTAS